MLALEPFASKTFTISLLKAAMSSGRLLFACGQPWDCLGLSQAGNLAGHFGCNPLNDHELCGDMLRECPVS
jgi:hypothetical protein